MGEPVRDDGGRYAKRRRIRKFIGVSALLAVGVFFIWGHPMVMDYLDSRMYYVAEPVEAAVQETEQMAVIPIGVLEDMLWDIVWKGETDRYVMKPGEIFPTFDPNSTEYASCVKRHGWQPNYCTSYGPAKIKLSMIHGYWPQLNDGAKLTDMEAMAIINDNEKSKRFFLDCAVKIKGCANHWTSFTNNKAVGQGYVDLLRSGQSITVIVPTHVDVD